MKSTISLSKLRKPSFLTPDSKLDRSKLEREKEIDKQNKMLAHKLKKIENGEYLSNKICTTPKKKSMVKVVFKKP